MLGFGYRSLRAVGTNGRAGCVCSSEKSRRKNNVFARHDRKNNLEKAKAFYDALLGTLDVRPAKVDGHRIFYITKTGVFSVSKPINGEPATPANGGTIGFACSSPEQADAWHAAGIANGATSCENPPGVREGPGGKLYLAYLRDLDGNKICAMHRMA